MTKAKNFSPNRTASASRSENHLILTVGAGNPQPAAFRQVWTCTPRANGGAKLWLMLCTDRAMADIALTANAESGAMGDECKASGGPSGV
jgi:hypothetical protein